MGGGLKYRLVNREGWEFDFGSGFMYEHEKWEDLLVEDVFVYNEMIKSSSYIKSNIELSDQVSLAFISFYKVGFDKEIDSFRQRISGQLQFQFEISNHFGFMVEGNIDCEDKPVIPINKTIYAIRNGLRYKF